MTTATLSLRMMRPRRVLLGGVCAGLAEHLGARLVVVRLVLVGLALCGGAGILFYLWLWAFTPLEPAVTEDAGVRRGFPVAIVLLVAALIGMIVAQSTESTADGRTLNGGMVATLLFVAGAIAWSATLDRRDPHLHPRFGRIVRWVALGILALTGVTLLGIGRYHAITVIFAAGMLVLAAGALLAPFVLRLWNERMTARAAAVREQQRAEIAAHLHDSVLQTLALIQNRAGVSSEIARLARAQERELRDWLFAGTTPIGNDLASELRESAAAIELEYPARIDVVVAGEPHGAADASVLAAAREAMVNAARHAGGEVSVYVEFSPAAVDVFVRDRGDGFDVDALPGDRLGVRESIIGRMTRAGGTATVRSGDGTDGTEVHLHLDAATRG